MEKTNAYDRIYQLVKLPNPAPKGAQPSTVLAILLAAGKPLSAREVAKQADARGYFAQAGTLASVSWHLHQFSKAGYTTCLNRMAAPAQPATPEIDFGTDTVADHA